MTTTWTQYTDRMDWVLYAHTESGYLVRDTRNGKTYTASSLDEVHGIAADLSELEDFYGAGDLVHKLSKHVGVQRCGKCAQRQTFLNRMLPMLWPKY